MAAPCYNIRYVSILTQLFLFDLLSSSYRLFTGAAVAQWLGRPPLISAIRTRYPASSLPNFRVWESCCTMPLAGGFSRGTPASPCPCIPAPLRPMVTFHVMPRDDDHLRVPAAKPSLRNREKFKFSTSRPCTEPILPRELLTLHSCVKLQAVESTAWPSPSKTATKQTLRYVLADCFATFSLCTSHYFQAKVTSGYNEALRQRWELALTSVACSQFPQNLTGDYWCFNAAICSENIQHRRYSYIVHGQISLGIGKCCEFNDLYARFHSPVYSRASDVCSLAATLESSQCYYTPGSMALATCFLASLLLVQSCSGLPYGISEKHKKDGDPTILGQGRGGVVVRLLISHVDESGSTPVGVGTRDFRTWESCLDDAAGRAGFLGDLPFTPPPPPQFPSRRRCSIHHTSFHPHR
ncbi:hypothetical protein PR048_019015 [Dryococelus australis]|uniref:Uncharacterized protein n=1 Tax=Dryococelus australis TaxID=614101 RepID=A0ABQ9H2F3_9NEOP|nr:hypothetical protein PR048_019015 [Dryococelus australis]